MSRREGGKSSRTGKFEYIRNNARRRSFNPRERYGYICTAVVALEILTRLVDVSRTSESTRDTRKSRIARASERESKIFLRFTLSAKSRLMETLRIRRLIRFTAKRRHVRRVVADIYVFGTRSSGVRSNLYITKI